MSTHRNPNSVSQEAALSKERQCGLRRRGAPTPSIYRFNLHSHAKPNSRSWYMLRVRYGTYRSVGTIIPTPTGMSEYYDETVFSAVISDVLALLAGPRGLSRSRTVGSGEGRAEGATPVSAPRVLRPHSCSHIPCTHPAASPVTGDALEGAAWEGAGDLPRRARNMRVVFPSAAIEFHISR